MFLPLSVDTVNTVNSVPVLTSGAAMTPLFLTGLLALFSGVLTPIGSKIIDSFESRRSRASRTSKFIGLGLVVFGVVCLISSSFIKGETQSSLSQAESIESVTQKYGIDFTVDSSIQFSMTDEPESVLISGITTITGDRYDTGTLLSQNGRIFVYVYESGKQEPTQLVPLTALPAS